MFDFIFTLEWVYKKTYKLDIDKSTFLGRLVENTSKDKDVFIVNQRKHIFYRYEIKDDGFVLGENGQVGLSNTNLLLTGSFLDDSNIEIRIPLVTFRSCFFILLALVVIFQNLMKMFNGIFNTNSIGLLLLGIGILLITLNNLQNSVFHYFENFNKLFFRLNKL